MSQTTQEFQNDNVQVQLSQADGCQVHLKVQASPALTEKCYQDAVKEIKREVSIPGFRRGKAPDSLVHDRFRGPIEKEWKELLLNTAFNQAVLLVQLFPFSRNSISKAEIRNLSKEKGAEMLFAYECEPEIPEFNFEEIELTRLQPPSISEEMVDHFLTQLRIETADLERVESEGQVQEGDVVIVTIENMEKPDAPELIDEHRTYLMEPNGVTPWVFEHLKGLKVGDTAEGTLKLEELLKGQKSEKESEATPVRVTVKLIARGTVPEIDDERAKTWGADNVAQLRERAREQLERSLATQIYDAHTYQLRDRLLDAYPFEVPRSLTEGIVEESLPDALHNLKDQNLSEEEFKKQEAELQKELREYALRQVRMHFLMQKVIKGQEIQIDPAEVNLAYIRESFQRIQRGEEPLDSDDGLSSQEQRDQTQAHLRNIEHKLERKAAVDYILSQVRWKNAEEKSSFNEGEEVKAEKTS